MTLFYDPTDKGSGHYLVNILKAEIITDEDEQKCTVLLDIQPTGFVQPNGQMLPRDDSWPQRRIFMPITDNTMGTKNEPGWVRTVLLSLGMDLKNWDVSKFPRNNVAATCKHENYEGKPRERWALLYGKPVKAASRKQLQQLALRYGNDKPPPISMKNGMTPRAPEADVPDATERYDAIPF